MRFHSPEPAVALVRAVRERRFAEGLFCPRCSSRAVVRWGHFNGRQRYRCRGCGRCFSDLTETPLQWVKRLDRWPTYFRCLEASESVRRSAARTSISVSTAFRWRHRILEPIHVRHAPALRGLVEFADMTMPFSAKGWPRGKPIDWTPAMYFGNEPMLADPGCVVVIAHDRLGALYVERFDTRTLTGHQLRVVFGPLLADDSTLLCPSGRYGPYGFLIPARDGKSRRLVRARRFWIAERNQYHNLTAHRWLGLFRGWLRRFRGVATKYLPSYLAWRRILHLVEAGPWFVELAACCDETPP